MDRRVQKTRQGLQSALLALLREKPLEQIEIQEITDRANSARVTFYRHYGTKEDLLLDTIEQIYQDFEASFSLRSIEQLLDFRLTPPSYPAFAMMEKDRAFYKKIFTGSIAALVQQRVRHYAVQQIMQTISATPRFADLPLSLIANQFASVIIGNITWWLADDLPYPALFIARITHWMALTGAMALVGRMDELILPPPDWWRVPEVEHPGTSVSPPLQPRAAGHQGTPGFGR